jgi:hypothetical protein
LRPTTQNDRVKALYWFLWKEAWICGGPLGRAAFSIARALELIAE